MVLREYHVYVSFARCLTRDFALVTLIVESPLKTSQTPTGAILRLPGGEVNLMSMDK